MPPARVLIDFRKYPDAKHWQYEFSLLAEDGYGAWLWGPAGTPAQKGDDPPTTFETTTVKLVTNDWWAAMWHGWSEPEIYVDIITPAVWSEARITMIDLDLDVIRLRSGEVRVVDEDEFAEHQVALAYPDELIEGARAAAERVRAMLEGGEEPFASAGAARLAEAMALAAQSP